MPDVFSDAQRHAVDRLFRLHLGHLSPAAAEAYLRAHGWAREALKESRGRGWDLHWIDERGAGWTVLDRLTHWGCVDTLGAGGAELWQRLALSHYKNMATAQTPWQQATSAERDRRTDHWLLAQRLAGSPWQLQDLGAHLATAKNTPLRRSLAGQPVGTPACGWGGPNDGGWWGHALIRLDRWQAMASPTCNWENVVSAWFNESLMGRPLDGRSGWVWGTGGVRGARLRQTFLGAPGWEEEGLLPSEPTNSQMVRPAELPAHWSALAARILHRLAPALARSERCDVRRSLVLEGFEGSEVRWLTPEVQAALAQVAWAGLVRTPAPGSPAHTHFDGRALAALNVLVQAAPNAEWLPSSEQRQLAEAVREHQARWEASAWAHERALAEQPFAPRSHLSVWEWASARPSHVLRARRP